MLIDPTTDDPSLDLPSFVEALRRRAALHPGRRLYSFLTDGEVDEIPLTYGDLDRRARALAARLGGLGLEGERALLIYPPGLEFLSAFLGCLYAGVVAVPAYPPRLNRPMPRLKAIVADARPSALLTATPQLPDADRWAAGVPELGGLHLLATDAVPDDLADDWRDPGVARETLAFLQYTSGSTAVPKGVMVSHGNLLHNSATIRRFFRSGPDDRGVFWLPLYHDMGLIGGALQTLYCGGSSTLLSPVAFLQRPIRWLQAISRTGATISGGPNFAYDLCARKVTPDQKATLDLSRWRVAFNGAEPIRPETLDLFAEAFAPCGFRREAFFPCYGLAEATLLVSGGPSGSPPTCLTVRGSALERDSAAEAVSSGDDARTLVGSGPGAPDQEVAIVDPATAWRLPEGRVGEIWVSGPSVAQGYWGQPEATRATFRAVPEDGGPGPFLRTGDLGFLKDGELFVAGRLKDLLIVRGRNLYPQDIEWTVGRCHPSLRPDAGAAFSVEVAGEERLVVVQEAERQPRGWDADAVIKAVRRAVSDHHELEVYAVVLLRPMSIPKTSSGKVQRHACREAFSAGQLDELARSVLDVGAGPVARPDDRPPGAASPPSRDAEAIRGWITARLAGPLGVDPVAIDVQEPFAGFGLGSLQAVALAGDLESWLGRPLSPTLLYEYPTIETLSAHLADDPGRSRPATAPRVDPIEPAGEGDRVAIIGIGCRFPGARGPEAFWSLLRGGVEAVGEIPPDRWDLGPPDDPDPSAPGRREVRRAGLLDEVDRFDADFFGISPREARHTDPQQRLLLEVAWEALEDAGQVPERLAGTPVGVFVGISTNDYRRFAWADPDSTDAYTVAGNASSIAANRLSYTFDFRGPSLAIDTACSSSLVAVHLACRAILDGEASMALAGGVNLILSPEVMASFAKAGFLSPDGRCRTFDAGADGYVRGEGVGVIVLKPLARALADGDPIYAVVRGGAVNQDGRTNGLTAPSRQAQEAVLRDALRRAGVEPGRVEYVEAHGTGTLLGDPIEARALGAVMGEGRPADRPLAVGSVKTNIGHLEAAAGVAGLIKVALAFRHGAIPPSLHFEEPNPHIPFDDLRLRVHRALAPWPDGGLGLAGVSSFGFGGTNAHVVLERVESGRSGPPEADPGAAQLLPISARDPEALRELARSYRDSLASGDASLLNLAHTAGARRNHHDHRLALVARSNDEAAETLGAFLRGEARSELVAGRTSPHRRPKVAFVFSGQGTSWRGMGRDLLEREPVFRAAVAAVDEPFRRLSGWSLAEELRADAESSRLGRTEVAQPLTFAVQVGLSALWRSWGVAPEAVVGHSLGEVAAAHVSGALSLGDAVAVVFHRGRLMQRVSGRGKTAAVGLSPEETRGLISESEGRLWIAAINGPDATTISGEADAIRAAVDGLRSRQVFARVLDVDCAFHGPQMDPIRDELAGALAGIGPRPTGIPLISTVTGRPCDGRDLDGAYWGRNVREPVRFADAVGALAADGCDAFVEVGPHPALAGAISATLREAGRAGTVLPSLRREEDGRDVLLRSLAMLYTLGRSIDWRGVTPSGRHVRLPTYPWRRERHWLEAKPAPPRHRENGSRNGKGQGTNGHHGRNGDAPALPIEDDVRDLLYEVRWTPSDRDGRAPGGDPGRWLILADGGDVARALRSALEARGATCETAHPADDGIRHLLECGPFRGVVDLRGLRSEPTGDAEVAGLDADQVRVVGDSLRLARAMSGLARGPAPRLWLVTRGAQPVEAGSTPVISQAALWGLGRSVAVEHPQAWGGLIDLEPDAYAGQIATLAEQLLDPDGEDQVAFRGGRRHVARLARRDGSSRPSRPFALRPEGTYLITGGLGGLGLRTAHWLAERGARRLALLGRRGLPDRGAWDDLTEGAEGFGQVEAIRALERLGATVIVEAADVADASAMAALFERLRRTLPPLRGVIHAAGVVSPEGADEADLATLSAVLRPKVAGTLVLDRLTRGQPLDFFVAFSSVASILGAREASYAAANQFLDAFARRRAAEGRPFLSVNFGPWAGPGMADSADRARAFRVLGVKPLGPDRAFRALERLLGEGAPQAAVADIDWLTFKVLYGQDGRRRLLELVADAPGPDRYAHGSNGTNGTARDWREGPPEGRRDRLTRYFRERVAGVLRLEPDRIDPDRPLDTLGLDSLMAIELKSGVEADLGTPLPLTSLLEGPTITQLADQALSRWEGAGPGDGLATAPGSEPSPVAGRSSDHPISAGQRALWSLHQLDPRGSAFHMAGAVRIRAELDGEALRRSFQRLVDRHESLRTTFSARDGEPVQRVHDRMVVGFRVEDVSAAAEPEILDRLTGESQRPFDLEAGPLFRASLFSRGPLEHFLLIVMHHAVGDFWSIALLMHELGRTYPAERAGAVAELPPLPLRYVDFARSQAEMLAGPEGERLRDYWLGQLAGPLPVLDLPTDRPRSAARSPRGASRTLRLDASLTRRLADLGRSRGASLYVTLLAAFQALLGRLSGQEDVIVGSPVAGRGRPHLTEIVGYFVNPLPLRASLAGDPAFSAFLDRVRRTVLDALEHQDYPFPMMVDRLQPARDPGRSPIFQVMFAYQKAQRLDAEGLTPFALREAGAKMTLGGIEAEALALRERAAQFDLTMMAVEEAGGVTASLEYRVDLFDAVTADRMLDRFRLLLEGIADDPGRPVSALPILSDEERRRVLVDWNATGAPSPEGPFVHERIASWASRTPGAVAVACGDRRLTYRELDDRASRLAARLRRLGVGSESRVGLCLGRSVELVVGVLGILKAGGAYVPLDPDYPVDRLAFMLDDARVSALVTQEALRDRLSATTVPVVCLGAEDDPAGGEAELPPAPAASPDNLAYVIYTSGSTGRPKGVLVTHRNLAHSTDARSSYYQEPVAGFLLLSSVAFDSSVAGLFWTLCGGGRLVIPHESVDHDPHRLARLIDDHRVSHLLAVPSLYALILAEAPAGTMAGLRTVIVAGEPCPRDLPGTHLARLPWASLDNEYGPTEATVWSTVHRCGPSGGARPVPIGRPIAGSRVYLLDRDLRPVPVGVPGELHIGGDGVARGYLDRPSLTADRFLPDPFGGPGGRIYRTGDLARWRDDGTLDFLGRADHQVKVRGFRIELGEVEAALSRHPAIREAVAAVREETPGDPRLVAYLVPSNGRLPEGGDLRRWLKSGLPDYMIPSSFVTMAALPLSPNGKIDRGALPAPAAGPSGAPAPFEAPVGPVEEALAKVAAEVLGLDRVGIHDDLFAMGVDSIRAIQIASRARRAGLDVDPGQLFRHPSIAELAPELSFVGPAPEGAPRTPTVPEAGDAEIEDSYPASPAQAGMLFHALHDAASGAYVQQLTCVLRGDFDDGAFAEAWRGTIGRHPILRTAFVPEESGPPRQVVHRRVELPREDRDWGALTPTEQQSRLEGLLRADRALGFETERPPLMRLTMIRLADDARRMIWSYHHLLMDGWCLPILLGDVLAGYEAARAGLPYDPPPSPPYRRFIDWLGRRDLGAAEAYWRRELRGFREPTPLAVDRPVARADVDPYAEREARLGAGPTAALGAMARRHRLTLNTVVQGAWALLLSRYSGRGDVVFGATVSGRPAELPGVESMVGPFINTLPVRVAVDEDADLPTWLQGLQARQSESRRYDFSPLAEVQGWSEVPRGAPLFESILVFENYPFDESLRRQAGGLGIESVRVLERTSFPLTLMVFPGAELRLRVDYDARRFDDDAIDRLLGHLRTLLDGFATGPGRRLADLPMLTLSERQQWGRRSVATPVGADPTRLDQLSEPELDTLIGHLLSSQDEARDE